jgi:hypothetical protein
MSKVWKYDDRKILSHKVDMMWAEVKLTLYLPTLEYVRVYMPLTTSEAQQPVCAVTTRPRTVK